MIKYSPKILIIQSNKSELKRVEIFIEKIFETYNLPQQNFNKVLLCVSEAVINSIEHGNLNDKNKTVTIKVVCNNKQLKLEIIDEGNGFNMNELDNPTCLSNIKKESGRGVFIINSLSDNFKCNEQGSGVQFKIEC